MTHRRSKQQRLEKSRLQRAREQADHDRTDKDASPPPGAVMADPLQLTHNNTYGLLPRFYVDKVVECRQCGKEEVWPAERQKWWYRSREGQHQYSGRAVSFLPCGREGTKDEARRVHLEGVERKNEGRKT